ncbi:hypothetical protein [Methylocystis sp. JR02]|uniref:hypothetical protein n=1 Tax=Methylocystis sp. JR02 TaxID=3046284 RepID=UPI0024BB8005|nr:hypothetical protein [Methylocystis sp. JR02]MDJ0449630.1 hypothetical protein [Methylocystis sp. JR02]
MPNTEGPNGQPPAAWVWSQYRGVLPADAPIRETPAASPVDPVDPPSSVYPAAIDPVAPAASRRSGWIGLGVAGAVLVIAGLTWLFTSRPAAESPAPAPTEATQQKSEADPPPAVEPAAVIAPAAVPAPAPAVQEAPKPAEAAPAAPPAPAHAPAHAKKKHKG